jgi:hypothetical protein
MAVLLQYQRCLVSGIPLAFENRRVDADAITESAGRVRNAQERLIWLAASIRSVRWSSSALVKDVAQMLPEEKLGAPPREAMCAARP